MPHADDTPTDESTAPAESTDQKDAFRAALERKKQHQHPHEQASHERGGVHDSHGAAGGRRLHRRKSG